MFRRLSAACALLALLAMGFVAPSLPPFQVGRTATVGGRGVVAPLALAGRRLRAPVDGPGSDALPDGVDRVGADLFGLARFGFGHLWWLSTPTRLSAPELVVGTLALVVAPAAVPSLVGTPRTSRGPPAFVTL
ncbi:MAG TPA: hypothetical protein VGP07_22575 [Polyangia bacterium]|jgi:hypothetical protein